MKLLDRVLRFFNKIIDRIPPYIDPLPWMWWIILWLILPLLLSLMGLM